MLSHWWTSPKWRLRSPGQTQPTFDIIILCNNLISLLLLSFHLFLIRLQLAAAQLLKSQNPHPCIGQTYKHTIKSSLKTLVKEWVKGVLV